MNLTMKIRESTAAGLTRIPGKRRARICLIEGDRWGSSGYYPRDILERDGPTVWPAGTQIFVNHQTEAEHRARPEGSLYDLAGKLITTPVYEDGGLHAIAEFNARHAPLVEALHEDIGVSIRADARTVIGEKDGRTGPIVTELLRGLSVDLVTVPGAGGRIIALLESIRHQGETMKNKTPAATAAEEAQEPATAGAEATFTEGETPAVSREEFDALAAHVEELAVRVDALGESETPEPAAEASAPANDQGGAVKESGSGPDQVALAKAVAAELASRFAIHQVQEGAGTPRGTGQTPGPKERTVTDNDIIHALQEGRR